MGCTSSAPADVNQESTVSKTETTQKAASGRFTYQTGTCALEYWEPVKELGEGSISSIHLVKRRTKRINVPYQERVDIMSLASANQGAVPDTQDVYALKSIIKAYVRNERFLEEMRNEIYTMSHLDHPNVVTVFEAYERKRHIYLIMEYCAGGDLNGRKLTEPQAANIVDEILSAVAYLHANKVVHRDLKAENIMFDKPGEDATVKIIDFGLATRYLSDEHKRMTDKVGTVYTMAPQVLQGVYNYKCDLWSVGVIVYVLLSGGQQPFYGPIRPMPWEQRRKIMIDRIMRCDYMRMQGGIWDGVSQEGKEFVASLLQMDPKKRPTAKEALKSPWIQRYANGSTALTKSPKEDLNYHQVHEFKRNAAQFLTRNASESEILDLHRSLETIDRSNEGKVSVGDFLDVLSKMRFAKDEDISILCNTRANKRSRIDYLELIGTSFESKSRRKSERLGEAFSVLDIDKTSKVSKSKLFAALQDKNSHEELTSVLENVAEDENGLVSIDEVLKHVDEKYVALMNQVYSEMGYGESFAEESLVDPCEVVIPGGRNESPDRPAYVYDEHTKTLRKY